MRHAAGAVLLMALLGQPLRAEPAADEPAFWKAYAAQDYAEAGKVLQSILRARLPGLKGHDPALDAMMGSFSAEFPASADAAARQLSHAAQTAAPERRPSLQLTLARVQEQMGRIDAAEAGYRALLGSSDAAVARVAAYAAARLMLGRSPSEASALLQKALAPAATPADRWEGDLLLSRALILGGQAEPGRAALARAWNEAPAAASPHEAVLRTASDLAIDAADRRSEVQLQVLVGGRSSFEGVARLPLCDATLRPDDLVTVEIAGNRHHGVIYSVVRASRPGIGERFTRALAAGPQRLTGEVLSVALRCRTSPSPEFDGGSPPSSRFALWADDAALYASSSGRVETLAEVVAKFGEEVRWREEHLGASSPQLIPVLLAQMSALIAQATVERNPGYVDLAKEDLARAEQIATSAGAPPAALAELHMMGTRLRAQPPTAAELPALAHQALDATLAQPGQTMDGLMQGLNGFFQLPLSDELKGEVIDRLLAFANEHHVPADDPRRQALVLRRIDLLQTAENVKPIAALAHSAMLAPDLCRTAPRPPSHNGSPSFTADDYPTDLMQAGISGEVWLDVDVTPAGTAEQARIVAAAPPRLFDEVTLGKIRQTAFNPAEKDGRPIRCRGIAEHILWRLPGSNEPTG